MIHRAITLLPMLLLFSLAGRRSEGDGTAVAQVRAGADPMSPAHASPVDVTQRRLWTSEYVDLYASSISANGRYLPVIDWGTGDLAVRDLRTGTLHRPTAVQNERGKPRMTERKVIFHNPEFYPYYPFDWSPDRSDRGEEVQALRLDLGDTQRIRWLPDGGSHRLGRDDRGRRGFHWIDLETGSYETIVRNDQLDQPTPRGDFDISADGRTIWFAVEGHRLLAFDLESGTSRSIEPAEWRARGSAMDFHDMRVARSPDGTRLTLVAPDTISSAAHRWIGTMPVQGGTFTPLARVDDGNLIQGPEWSADGRFVVFATLPLEGGDGWTMWIVPAAGGEVRPLKLDEHSPARIRMHPDGRRVAFLAGESRGEVWVMDGLDGR